MKTCLITLDCEQGSISQRGSRWWSETEKRKTLPPRIDGARESATVSHLAEKFRSHNKESFNPYDAQQNIDRSVIDFFPFIHPHFVVAFIALPNFLAFLGSRSPIACKSHRREAFIVQAVRIVMDTETRRRRRDDEDRRTFFNNVIINEFPLYERKMELAEPAQHLPDILRIARSIGSSRNMLSG